MRVFDASAIVWAWDEYPAVLFPGLWTLLASEAAAGTIVIPSSAMKEIGDVSPDCHEWLKDCGLKPHPMSNASLRFAQTIRSALGIVGEAYHPKGVDENDIFIIATAMELGLPLVSEEALQLNLPSTLKRYKIPATCGLPEVRVKCIRFIDYLRSFNKPIS